MTINAADEYAKIIVASKEAAFLPIAEQILSAKVCPRCCLRHAGVRGDIYATTAPTAPELLSALQALGAGSSPSQPAQDVSASADDPGTAGNGHAPAPSAASKSNSEPIGARQSAPSSPSGRPPAAAQAAREADGRCGRSDGPADARAGEHSQDRPCSVCLGVLQTVGSLTPASPSEDVTAAVQQWDSSSGRAWHPSASCCPVELARSAKALGHAGEAFRLEVVLPGAVQVREQALWHWLRRSDSARACFAGHAPAADVVSVKDALRLAVAPTLAAGLGKALREDADLCLCLLFVHPPSATEADFLLGLKPRGRGAKRKKGQQPTSIGKMANENLAQLAAKMVESHFNTHARIPPLAPAQAPYAFFSCLRNLQYIAGFYRKLSRDISHTPFFVVGQRLGRTSVQEVLEALLQPDLRFSHAKFMSAGREDLDVRMLGRGRPFVLELANALGAMPPQSRLQELQEQLAASGAGVEVLKLQAAPKSILKAIKDGEGEKQKSYLARCRLPFPVTDAMLAQLGSMKDVVLQQTTPARVEHRRAMLVRGKTIHEMRAERDAEDPSGLLLHLRTQAGTYIKEFVHSDEGRTVPNLGSLLGCQEPAQILELDVLEIHMPFLT